MSRHAKVTPLSAKDKEYLEARNQSAKYFNRTTTTTSGAAGESSNAAEDITEEERKRERVRLAVSATKSSKQVLESVGKRDRISTGDRALPLA